MSASRRAPRAAGRHRHRHASGTTGALLVAMVLMLTGGLVGSTFAVFNGETTNAGNAFYNGYVAGPGTVSATPMGTTTRLTWGSGANGDGYALLGQSLGTNPSSKSCPAAGSAGYSSLFSTGSVTTYDDTSSASTYGQGVWFCYQVQTRRGSTWTSTYDNATALAQLGVVATSVSIGHVTTVKGCKSPAGADNAIDCGDTITIQFNQPVVQSSTSNAVVCTDASTTTGLRYRVLLGMAKTSTCPTKAAALAVGILKPTSTSTTLSASTALTATFSFGPGTDPSTGASVSVMTITVTAGSVTVGGQSSWTYTPATPESATSPAYTSVTGGNGICISGTGCVPTAAGTF